MGLHRMQAFDGVTTAMDLELGRMPVGEWYENCAKEGRPINYGISVAWMMARQIEFNPEIGRPRADMEWMATNFRFSEWVNSLADRDQIASITALLEQGLKEGAIGIGLPYGYMPAAGTKEMVGMDADIIVFDPETVADRATFKESCQTSAGMKHVLVNGTFLIRDEQLDTEALPGKPVRRPVTA